MTTEERNKIINVLQAIHGMCLAEMLTLGSIVRSVDESKMLYSYSKILDQRENREFEAYNTVVASIANAITALQSIDKEVTHQ